MYEFLSSAQNTKEDILKYVGNQTVDVPHEYYGSQWVPSTVWLPHYPFKWLKY